MLGLFQNDPCFLSFDKYVLSSTLGSFHPAFHFFQLLFSVEMKSYSVWGLCMPVLTEQSIVIVKDVDAVFDYVVNMENYAQWFPGVLSVKSADSLPSGSPEKTYEEVAKDPIKGPVRFNIKVKEARRNQFFVTEGSYVPLLPKMTVVFQKINFNETRLDWKMESRNNSWLFKLTLLPVAKHLISKRAKLGLIALKRNLEGA